METSFTSIVLKGPWQKSFLDDLESQASNFAHGIDLGIY